MADLCQLSVVDAVGFAAKFFDAVMSVEVAAVGQAVEIIAAFGTVGVCHILKEAQSVQRPVFDHLVVRDDHGFGQAQTLTITLHVLEAGLALPFWWT